MANQPAMISLRPEQKAEQNDQKSISMGTKPLAVFDLTSIKPSVFMRMFGINSFYIGSAQTEKSRQFKNQKSHYPGRLLLQRSSRLTVSQPWRDCAACLCRTRWFMMLTVGSAGVLDSSGILSSSNYDVIIATLSSQLFISFPVLHVFFFCMAQQKKGQTERVEPALPLHTHSSGNLINSCWKSGQI